jgi:hypothetical protein
MMPQQQRVSIDAPRPGPANRSNEPPMLPPPAVRAIRAVWARCREPRPRTPGTRTPGALPGTRAHRTPGTTCRRPSPSGHVPPGRRSHQRRHERGQARPDPTRGQADPKLNGIGTGHPLRDDVGRPPPGHPQRRAGAGPAAPERGARPGADLRPRPINLRHPERSTGKGGSRRRPRTRRRPGHDAGPDMTKAPARMSCRGLALVVPSKPADCPSELGSPGQSAIHAQSVHAIGPGHLPENQLPGSPAIPRKLPVSLGFYGIQIPVARPPDVSPVLSLKSCLRRAASERYPFRW